MFLLGYTLEVTLRVIRPAAFGTEDFICSYPDWNEGNWPQVFLIAEDDRHYNVLVN
jgi:ubiquitin thioesterase otulin